MDKIFDNQRYTINNHSFDEEFFGNKIILANLNKLKNLTSAGVGAIFSTRTALFFVRRAAHLLTLDGARVFLARFVGLAVVAVRPLFRSLRSLQHSKRQWRKQKLKKPGWPTLLQKSYLRAQPRLTRSQQIFLPLAVSLFGLMRWEEEGCSAASLLPSTSVSFPHKSHACSLQFWLLLVVLPVFDSRSQYRSPLTSCTSPALPRHYSWCISQRARWGGMVWSQQLVMYCCLVGGLAG